MERTLRTRMLFDATPPSSDMVRPASLLTSEGFVGRESEMATLRAHLEYAYAGAGRLVLLVGDPGIGKTRAAQEFAGHARRRGARVLSGSCYEGEGAPPFWPWVQILRTALHEGDSETVHATLGTGAAAIAQVIPEVRERCPLLPELPPLTSEPARFRFFDSYTAFLKNLTQHQPLVVILDDLHWADAGSLLLLQFLVQQVGDLPMLVVGAYREVAVELHHPFRQTLGHLARAPGSDTIVLHGLTEPEVAAFLHQATGVSPHLTLLNAVHQHTEGNPFFLMEVVRLLATKDQHLEHPSPHTVTGLPLPPRVSDMLSHRLASLSPACLQVLTLASVIGRSFTLEVLTRACDLPRMQILERLEEALQARIITADRQAIDHYGFTHILLRETVYNELTLTQRVTFHRKIGEAVEQVSLVFPSPLAELAYHFAMAAQSGQEVEKAIAYATQAGAQAAGMLAYEEASKHYLSALRLLTLQAPDEARRCELLLALGDAQRRAGQRAQTRTTFLAAATVARQLEDPRQLARAALGFAGLWVAVGVVDQAVVALLEEALQTLEEEEAGLRARLYARLATEFWFATSRDQRVMFSQRAVQLARHTTDQETLGYCLQAHHLALWGSPHLEERLSTTAEIQQLAEQMRDPELALHGYSRRVADLLEVGDIVAVDTAMAAYMRGAEELRQPQYLWQGEIWKGMRAIMAGRFEDGERFAHQALALGQQAQVSQEDAVLGFGIQLFTIRREQGRLLEMEASLKGFLAQYPAIPTFRCALAFLYSEVGQEPEAREHFEELARQGFTDLPQDLTLPLSLAFLAHVCAFLGDPHRAAQLYPLLLPYADGNIVTSSAIAYHEPAAHALGLLATVLERWDDTQHHFTAAITMTNRLGARPRLADAQYAYAKLLLTREPSGDRALIRTLLDSALATAQELGMGRLEEKVTQYQAKEQAETQRLQPRRVTVLPPPSPYPLAHHLPQLSVLTPPPSVFRHEGDYWTILHRETSFRLRHIRGLDYVAHLLQHPHVEIHVLDLITRAQPLPSSPLTGCEVAFAESGLQVAHADHGEALLDAKARGAYRQRLRELQEELEEARAWHDLGRAEKAQQELDFLSAELTRGCGLGGRPRQKASATERARVNVVKGIKAALAKIADHSPLLEHYLATTIKTGVCCVYTPSPFLPLTWEL